MIFNREIQERIAGLLSENRGEKCLVKNVIPVSGGSINEAYKLETSNGSFFVKINSAVKYPLMFEAEAKGLQLLASANEVYIPGVITASVINDDAIITMEFVEQGRRKNDFFFDFGKRLARLHKHSAEKFGLDHDNYIGSLYQSNRQKDNWIDFFIEERLERQIKLAREGGEINASFIRSFENLFKRLREIFPEETPSLLHGDLWSGNYMTSPQGSACIFDPAAYYGHREMDLAMTKLFGGFDREFYEGYNEEFPLEKSWRQRLDICNLYPLMVHVNLFGGSYLSQVELVLKYFK